MLKNILILPFLILLLSGCGWGSKNTIEYIYVDRIVPVYPPDSLLIVPDEPVLIEKATNEDLVNWSLDLREVFRGVKGKLEAVKQWKVELQEQQ